MSKILSTLVILFVITLSGCNQDAQVENNPADGNVTEKESRMMQKAWCEHNEGEDFAEEQCKRFE